MEDRGIKHPVTVYLDTSDYSCLAEVDHTPKGEKYREILAGLLRLRDSGNVVFRYSIVHLMEFLKSESSTIETSLRKTGVMTNLCGSRVFRYPLEVWDRELEAFSAGAQTSPEELAASDKGEWYPTDVEVDDDDVSFVWREMESIMPGVMENGRPKREFLRAIEEAFDGAFLQEMVPVVNDLNTKNFVLKMLMGKLEPGELTQKALAGITEPNLFVSHYFDKLPEAQKLFRNFGQLEETLYHKTRATQDFIRDSGQPGDDRIKAEIKRYLKDDQRWGYLGRRGLDDSQQLTRKMAQGVAHSVLRSISAHIMIFSSYFAHNFTPNESLREVKLSDVGDLLHATYLPYCDIFRTDGYFSGLIRQHGAKFKTRIVSNLASLIPEIEKAIGERGSQNKTRHLRLIK